MFISYKYYKSCGKKKLKYNSREDERTGVISIRQGSNG